MDNSTRSSMGVLARYVRLYTETGDPDLPQLTPAIAASLTD